MNKDATPTEAEAQGNHLPIERDEYGLTDGQTRNAALLVATIGHGWRSEQKRQDALAEIFAAYRALGLALTSNEPIDVIIERCR